MFRKLLPFFLIVESPVHAGGVSELGLVDLPIQRERHTMFPKIEGSGIKGCIREAFESSAKTVKINSKEMNVKDEVSKVFGPEDGNLHAGAISFTDAKILLFPVKSLKGIFAWITCPMVLTRFLEDMKLTNKYNEINDWNLTNIENTITTQTNLCISNKIILEEFTFEVKESPMTSKIAKKLSEVIFPLSSEYTYWKEKLTRDLVILTDDDFKHFVTSSTEVITRVKISETGTVQSGALWTEEYLPEDTVLYCLAMTTPLRVDKNISKEPFTGSSADEEARKVMEFFVKGVPEALHVGGNQTIGKGLVRINLWR